MVSKMENIEPNARSPIRDFYSHQVYQMFKKMKPVPFRQLSSKQQKIVIREQEAEGVFEGTQQQIDETKYYIEHIKYLFVKVSPDLLPRSATEDLKARVFKKHTKDEVARIMKEEKARLDKVERSIADVRGTSRRD